MSKRYAWLLPVAMTALVYYPITHNYFFSDDFLNFWYLANEGAGQLVLRLHGGHSCVTRNLAMVSFHHFFGMDPRPYFWAVLVTHLLNVFLLFEVVRWLTASRRAACLSAALWGMAPVHHQTLGWFAVYGQVLAGVCTLWVLAGLARARAGRPSGPIMRWSWGMAMIAGALSFGVGIGVALVMPAIAWLLLPPGRRARTVAVLASAAVVAVGLYVGQQYLYEWLYAEPSAAGSLVIALAIWRAEIAFVIALAGDGIVALLLGALDSPTFYPGLVGGVVISAAMLLTGMAVGFARERTVRPLLACALLAGGVYVLIAAGRGRLIDAGNMEATIRTERYQYAGSLAAAAALGIVASALGAEWRTPDWVKNTALVSWSAAALALTVGVGPPIDHFDVARNETERVLHSVDAIVAAVPHGIDVYIPNRPFHAVGFLFGTNMAAFPGWAAVFAMFHADDVVDGHRVRFVMEDAYTLTAARHGRRAPVLLTGPLFERGATPSDG